MRYEEWEPIYLAIIKDFGYSVEEDERAARCLAEGVRKASLCDDRCLSSRIRPEVTVCGDSAELARHLDRIGAQGTVIAADGATKVLMESGIVPDIVVTDLDGDIDAQLRASAGGAVTLIHAHGDNLPAILEHAPRFTGPVVPTTQSRPFGPVRNFGGFTDGDRGVMLARHFHARRVHLLGFDFMAPRAKPGRDSVTKLRKLEWARHLIFDLNPPGVCLSIP
jgi:hypothetical protein